MNTSIKSSTIFLILLLQLEIKAHNYNTPVSAYRHLHEVNKRWSNHINDVPKYNIVFLSDIDHIQYHLLNVENILRKDSPKGISAEILKNRLLLLDELHNYALNKIFPTNLYHSYRQPYFIDDYGVYCAVGYLISVSGHDELARQIRNQNNYDYIQNIKNELLQSWVRKYGFSVDELAWIQPTYAPTTIFEPLQYGTTGPVDLL
ncbi:MAG: hypothetical protein H7Y00_15315 [Fimbriimonadaceae bacterium]|nr:hypothetical protein [Chitinophagales bacterium]